MIRKIGDIKTSYVKMLNGKIFFALLVFLSGLFLMFSSLNLVRAEDTSSLYDDFNDSSKIQSFNNVLISEGIVILDLGNLDYLNYSNDKNLVSIYLFGNLSNIGQDYKRTNHMNESIRLGFYRSDNVPAGFSGYSISLNGSSTICTNSKFTFNATSDHTLCWWSNPRILKNGGNQFAQMSIYDTWTTTAGKDYMWTINNGNAPTKSQLIVPNVYAAGGWVNICQRYNKTTLIRDVIINGVNKYTKVDYPIGRSTAKWCLGSYGSGGFWDGNIYQPMWFNRTLDDSEILKIYSNTYYNSEGVVLGKSGNFSSIIINTNNNISEIINITWAESNTDENNNISVELSADGGNNWYKANNGQGLSSFSKGNQLVYRVFFNTKDKNISFDNANIEWIEEESPADITAPFISNVQNSSITNSSAVISWQTDEDANETIEYGLTLYLENVISNNEYKKSHLFNLLDLLESSVYYYKIGGCDAIGNCANSSVYEFKTLAGLVCGNNLKESGEACDGTDLVGEGCASQGYDLGTLSCLRDCSGFNISGCSMIPCSLTGAYWSVNNAIEGQPVQLIVEGQGCNGQQVNFSVWEDDLLGDEPSNMAPVPSIFAGDSTNISWVAEWQCDGDVGGICTLGLPEYYFTAFLQENESIGVTSANPMLVVEELSPACGNGLVQGIEQCDDSNNILGDGCSDICSIEENYSCNGEPSFCHTIASGYLIIDHNAVEEFEQIPDEYLDKVKKMWFNLPGESHSSGYRKGLNFTSFIDPVKYNVVITESGSPAAYREDALRIDRLVRNQYNGWTQGAGEAEWYTWKAWPGSVDTANNYQIIKNHLNYSNTHNLEIAAIGFGWCWDATWHNDLGGTIDPVYNVRWAGASEGGPDGDLRWGLDEGDISLTGNNVMMKTYLAATEEYISYVESKGFNTSVFFTTGPIEGYTGEIGYQRYLKYEYIRDYVKANNKVLFDYADILSYSDSGSLDTDSWEGHVFPHIHPDNLRDIDWGACSLGMECNVFIAGTEDGDHIGQVGARRLGKAIWVMLAKMAGWRGVNESNNGSTSEINIPSYSTFDGATTNFSAVANISEVQDAVLEKTEYGKIHFSGQTLDFEGLDLDNNIIINNNQISINSSIFPELNVSAFLTLYDVSTNKAAIYEDGQICNHCFIKCGNDNDITFSVNHFGAIYSIGEYPMCEL